MTIEELKNEAEKMGYNIYKKPEYQCCCSTPYPNCNHKLKNGKWKCMDKYEFLREKKGAFGSVKTYCKLKEV